MLTLVATPDPEPLPVATWPAIGQPWLRPITDPVPWLNQIREPTVSLALNIKPERGRT
jgi:hypothetical protein